MIYSKTINKKKAGIGILISDAIEFKNKKLIGITKVAIY